MSSLRFLKCDYLEVYVWAKGDLPISLEVLKMSQGLKMEAVLNVSQSVQLEDKLFLSSNLNFTVYIGTS